jgi:membrane-associated PAP2 superfamily phosphatase
MLRRPRLYSAAEGFWIRHAGWPLLAFALAFCLISFFELDQALARAWYFETSSGRWLGGGAGEWWARGLLHDDARWVVRGIAAAAFAVWLLSGKVSAFRAHRRDAAYVFAAMFTAVAAVGLLKAVTNVDCPWDLAGFGGSRPHVKLFADRPDYLPRAQCFPGAHASSGFALLCFYFMRRDRAPRAARAGLIVGVVVGLAFSIAQEARGAHFLSHDLASAAIVWFVQLALYRMMLTPGGAPSGTLRPE